MHDKELALVAGAGPGLGHALMKCFNQEGFDAVGLARTKVETGTSLDIRQCDVSDDKIAPNIIEDIIAEFGPPRIVVHNTASLFIAPFMDTPQKAFKDCWSSMVQSAVVVAHSVLPSMINHNGGTFIVSGATASLRGGKNFSAFASAKFALRGLTQSLAREFQPQGIHVVHTLLDGIVDTKNSRSRHDLDPDSMMKTDDIAGIYYALSQQPRSTWTHELDLRPMTERF